MQPYLWRRDVVKIQKFRTLHDVCLIFSNTIFSAEAPRIVTMTYLRRRYATFRRCRSLDKGFKLFRPLRERRVSFSRPHLASAAPRPECLLFDAEGGGG